MNFLTTFLLKILKDNYQLNQIPVCILLELITAGLAAGSILVVGQIVGRLQIYKVVVDGISVGSDSRLLVLYQPVVVATVSVPEN